MPPEAPNNLSWPHGPSHLFLPGCAYIVTASTYNKAPHFHSPDRREFLLQALFHGAAQFGWKLEAWAVMSNHYHFVAQSPPNAASLKQMIHGLHLKTATWVNEQDQTPLRRVWFQYWDSCLTFEKSYLARLNYVHTNPVKHRLVDDAANYPWCSLAWFIQRASPAFCRSVRSFKCDRVNVKDDFELPPEPIDHSSILDCT